MKKYLLIIPFIFFSFIVKSQQVKILFDATKAETAGNADWIIDADTHNLGYSTGPAVVGGGTESNPQQLPTPGQATVTQSTVETYWQGALSAWGIECVKHGYWVETLPYNGQITYGNTGNPQDLSNYKVYIVCEPNILFTAAEKTAMMQFVQNGGGLFMVSDHDVSDRNNDGYDSPHIWDDFLSNNSVQSNPFGMTFDYANFSQTTTNIPNLPSDPLLHGTMGSVTSAMWSNGTSITMTPAVNSSVTGVVYKTGSSFGNTNVMVAHATYGSGKVVGVGDSSPCDDGTGDPNDVLYNGWTADAGGNHRLLLMNATIWLASSSGPVVTTLAANNITFTSATLNGSVNPQGVATTWHFEWGLTTAYGNSTTAVSAGSGSSVVTVNSPISSLSSGTTYHFRLVGVAGSNTVYGSDLQFTTNSSTLAVTPPNQNVTSPAGATNFAVTSNSAWTATSNQAWCAVTPSGTGNGTIATTYAANTLIPSRVASITVTVSGLAPVVVTVTQSGVTPTLSVTPPNQNVPASAGGSAYYTVTSNTSWSVVSDQAWCTVNTSGTGNGTITANYAINNLISPRVANITVTVTGLAPVVVTLTQDGASAILTLTPPNQNVASTAGNTNFSVTTTASSWTAASNVQWCTIPAGGNGSGALIATYTENTTTLVRIATIMVSAPGFTPQSSTITQSAASPLLLVTPPSQFVAAAAGTTNFAITSNSGWSAVSDASWCSVPASGSGSGTLTSTYQANPSSGVRTANIRVTVSGIPTVIVTVVQNDFVGIADFAGGTIRIIPNPSNGQFRIITGINGTINEVNIFDLSGKVVASRKCSTNSDYIFDFSASPAGSYLVKMKMSNDEILVRQLLIAK